ncbi:glycosyltransferase family 2 protein [bacterium]|nr:glycosyltransferase family 2 protein [bacterium]
MRSLPLVSVVMACYQDSGTVARALASMLAQSYSNWECLLINDGSDDSLEVILAKFQDPRIRYFHSPRNQGRGWAQALGLAQAQGEYLCFLDADDWLSPEKLRLQVGFLQDHPEFSAVSVALGLLDRRHRLVGVRLKGFAFGAAMLRTRQAREVGFDPSFRRSQDFDFFHRLLAGRASMVLPEVAYYYAFERGASPEVVLEGLAYNRRTFAKTLGQRPVSSVGGWLLSWLKTFFYRGLRAVGGWSLIQRARVQRPNSSQQQAFEQAWAQVQEFLP